MPRILNAEEHFSQSPLGVEIGRSTFGRAHTWKGSFNAGKLNCCLVDEVLPGDTVDLKMTTLTRMTTPYFPVMDDCFLDKYVFFVPMRLVWEHTKQFFGENNASAWIPDTEYMIPGFNINSAALSRTPGDVLHQMGIPLNTGTGKNEINALPLRAYRLIWNEWFRDQNTMAPKIINFGDTEVDTTLNTLLPVCRVHDYFGSCLPGTQKGEAIKCTLKGWAQVVTSANHYLSPQNCTIEDGMTMLRYDSTTETWSIAPPGELGIPQEAGNGGVYSSNDNTYSQPNRAKVFPNNLVVEFGKGQGRQIISSDDLDTVGIDINALRLAVATQRILEKLAIGGSRYTEMIKTFFGVTSPDARMQRPELLAYSRSRLNMAEVTQNSPEISGETMTPLGTIGAFSKSIDGECTMNHSFTEHGYLIGLFCVRHNRSYSQGIHKMWRRRSVYDLYLPPYAHIGEQPVYTDEIYAANFGTDTGNVFGYQEAWAEYRYGKNIAAGLLDPCATGTIGDVWTYTDKYTVKPTLSSSWMEEGSTEIARTLAVQNEDQFIMDCFIDMKSTRTMPVYSVPGLMDHF